MARKVQVTLIDDIDQTPADRCVSFALEGKSYEIDLSQANYDKLTEALAPYIQNGRRPARAARAAAPAVRRSGSSAGGNAAAIRVWAGENGFEVSDRGRIPADVLAAYEAAN